ncbi:ATP phosphoribosyltransferase regulatory subunit (plasmid) [Paroceanicella profunda]|uniref:ATP phosphoribosyltransferase regulatory subunit n=1 Tax=Paroceanicella profunda TaxID=2579971 RepID=A0A5B8G233_9RHOB|nr:ATP phosphoribosyltransferase regulatory subunit [Paroceanicella profunda]QDL94124.1 ATP phosphoribosyltransferase regulatory subunit [Paroceanicella profunda]
MLTARAYLPDGRLGAGLARLEAETARILRAFAAAGAEVVEPEALQPADVLLDLYGEDIRARAYVTQDPVAGEMMLRPDFTVPVVRLHMAHGAAPARYAYCGPVWRAQEPGSARPNEYLQAGFELFDAGDPAEADAEVFALMSALVGETGCEIATGDMGILAAVVDGLETAPHRRAALRRHLWRPEAFRRLLRRFGAGHEDATAARATLLAAAERGAEAVGELISWAGEPVGLRDAEDITARALRLAEEAATPPLTATQVAALDEVLSVSGPSQAALARLRGLAPDMPGLTGACDRVEARLEALSRRGIDAGALPFSTSFGRTTLEYYDGFVFGLSAPGRPDLPPLAQGGRYDHVTAVLGGGAGIPAVGAIIRPEALIAAQGGAA